MGTPISTYLIRTNTYKRWKENVAIMVRKNLFSGIFFVHKYHRFYFDSERIKHKKRFLRLFKNEITHNECL